MGQCNCWSKSSYSGATQTRFYDASTGATLAEIEEICTLEKEKKKKKKKNAEIIVEIRPAQILLHFHLKASA